MTGSPDVIVRGAEPSDAVGRLLHDFNREFEEATPGPRRLAERVRHRLAEDEVTVLLDRSGPDGVALLRFRPALWTQALECYLARQSLHDCPEPGRAASRTA